MYLVFLRLSNLRKELTILKYFRKGSAAQMQKLLSRSSYNSRRQENVIKAYARGILDHGVFAQARGMTIATQDASDTEKFHIPPSPLRIDTVPSITAAVVVVVVVVVVLTTSSSS